MKNWLPLLVLRKIKAIRLQAWQNVQRISPMVVLFVEPWLFPLPLPLILANPLFSSHGPSIASEVLPIPGRATIFAP
jgi:hypothetical protein